MKSLLFQDNPPHGEPSECALLPCRTEVAINVRKYGRVYRFVLRDKIAPVDPYLILVKAAAFARQTGEPYNGVSPDRTVKDFLLKSTVVI